MKPKLDPRWIIWTIIALAVMGIAAALTETCLWLEISGENVKVLNSMGCD